MNDTQSAAAHPLGEAAGSQTYLFLLAAEREYQWLLRKLGHDEWTVDLQAFQLTRQLAEHCAYMNTLWQSANEVHHPELTPAILARLWEMQEAKI